MFRRTECHDKERKAVRTTARAVQVASWFMARTNEKSRSKPYIIFAIIIMNCYLKDNKQ